jgi:malonyl-CoA O-methyltransferase
MTFRPLADIKAAFSGAADTYDANAHVQKITAEKLIYRLLDAHPAKCPDILEIGCGTGLFTEKLARSYPERRSLIATDISETMLHHRRWASLPSPLVQLAMNGERPCFTNASHAFNMIASNLAFQWFSDQTAAIVNLAEHLADQGVMILSTLGPQCFPVWRRALAKHGIKYESPLTKGIFTHDVMELRKHLQDFTIEIDSERVHQPYQNAHEFVRSLRAIGAHTSMSPRLPVGVLRAVFDGLASPYEDVYEIVYIRVQRR